VLPVGTVELATLSLMTLLAVGVLPSTCPLTGAEGSGRFAASLTILTPVLAGLLLPLFALS
jgi:hypothetical protein